MERAILSEKWALSAERGAFFLPGNQSLFARVSRGGLRLLFLFANQRREGGEHTHHQNRQNNLPRPCRSRSTDDNASREAVYRPLGVVYGLAATPQEGLMKAAISTDTRFCSSPLWAEK